MTGRSWPVARPRPLPMIPRSGVTTSGRRFSCDGGLESMDPQDPPAGPLADQRDHGTAAVCHRGVHGGWPVHRRDVRAGPAPGGGRPAGLDRASGDGAQPAAVPGAVVSDGHPVCHVAGLQQAHRQQRTHGLAKCRRQHASPRGAGPGSVGWPDRDDLAVQRCDRSACQHPGGGDPAESTRQGAGHRKRQGHHLLTLWPGE